MHDEYPAKRRTTIIAVIMGILLIISMLSFFDVFSIGDAFVKEYCEVPNRFECDDLKVTPQSISFTLKNKGDELTDLRIESSKEGCKAYLQRNLIRGSKANVRLDCDSTASRGKAFKSNLVIYYTPEFQLKSTQVEGRIKAVVTSNV